MEYSSRGVTGLKFILNFQCSKDVLGVAHGQMRGVGIVGYTEDIFTALEIQDELQTRYTSGTVFHAFLGEKLPDWKSAAALVRKIAENHKLPYYTLSPTYSVCTDHGYLTGEQYICPHCGQKTEVYSRITGYYRPVQNWNDGKSQEFKDRKVYQVEPSDLNTASSAPVAESVAVPSERSEHNAVPSLDHRSATSPGCPEHPDLSSHSRSVRRCPWHCRHP